ncbi:AAA family ATPase [Chengkuizengella marina]|uniref:ParA family protein n=1 Tax=Chengkuizengella marina TaxID=2507566 RepID=A0A6N9PY09_9BACL|nr:AAA family ATPase [Chengkuizengella marina]NBI27857.1 ParA family protein [Chengkuizengella marina]
MDKILLIVASNDREYIDGFSSYIRTSEIGKEFSITFFTDQQLINEYLQKNAAANVLLIDETWMSVEVNTSINIQVLCESNKGLENCNYKYHFKYQPINDLLMAVKKGYIETYNIVPENKNSQAHKTKVISVFSPAGGSGKSVFSINLIKQLTMMDEEVFYLNLETIYPFQFYIQSDDLTNQFSKLLYYIKTNPAFLQNQLDDYLSYHPVLHCDYINPSSQMNDTLDLQLNDIKTYIQLIKETKKYNAIIIDCSSSLHERMIGALQQSDYIMNILIDDIQCILKMKQLIQESNELSGVGLSEILSSKNIYIMNKYTNECKNNLDEHGFYIHAYLPYIPQWKSVKHIDQLLTQDVFNEKVIQAYKQWTGYLGGKLDD